MTLYYIYIVEWNFNIDDNITDGLCRVGYFASIIRVCIRSPTDIYAINYSELLF